MLAWIIYFRDSAVYNEQYIRFYIEEGTKLGIDIRLLLVEELEFGVKNNQWFIKYQKKDIMYPDFVICRAIHPLLSRQLEYMGIRVFNNSFVSEICNDKAKTYQYLAKTGISMVDSSFYKNCQVKEVLLRTEQPTVIKAVDGHGGSQVFLINPPDTAGQGLETPDLAADKVKTPDLTIDSVETPDLTIDGFKASDNVITKTIPDNTGKHESTENIAPVIDGLKCSDVVVQPLIGSRHQDLRIYVIGKEIIAAVLRTAKEGFKSNFSLGGEVCLYRLSEEEKRLVNVIIDQFDFGLVGIDFMIGDRGELIFNEIEDVVGSRMLYKCSDINIVELYLKYIIGRIKGQLSKDKAR